MELIVLIYLMGFLLPPALWIGGGIIGNRLEQAHFASLAERETAFAKTPCLNGTSLPAGQTVTYAKLSTGSVVVSVDRFKQTRAAFAMIIGGQVNAYSSLIERGRREALLRMKESAPNADMFINVRLVTATLSSGAKKGLGAIEVVAYGTALKFRPKND